MAAAHHGRLLAAAGVLLAVLLALAAAPGVSAHGSLTVPRSRNVLRPINGETWWKDHGNGHGGTRSAAGPKPLNGPGVCWSHAARMRSSPDVHAGRGSLDAHAGDRTNAIASVWWFPACPLHRNLRRSLPACQWQQLRHSRQVLTSACLLPQDCCRSCRPRSCIVLTYMHMLATSFAQQVPSRRRTLPAPPSTCSGGSRPTTAAASVSSCAHATPTLIRPASTGTR